MEATKYPSDMSDKEWKLIEPLIPVYNTGRPRTVDMRQIINAIFYLNRTGCQWAYIPNDYPKSSNVRYYYDCFRKDGTWEKIHSKIRCVYRKKVSREEQSSVAIVDSQSVKTTEQGGDRGFDGGKLVKGRKRNILVDSLGLLIAVIVSPANLFDGKGLKQLLILAGLYGYLCRMKKIFADQGYRGLFDWISLKFKLVLEIVKRAKISKIKNNKKLKENKTDLYQLSLLEFELLEKELTENKSSEKGFEVQEWRWIVERTFAWICRYRRMSKDYEHLCCSSESQIYIAMTRLMLKRLSAPG